MKLKPCPFCNGKPWSDGRVVCCPACAEESYLTVDEWNTRPIEDQQAEQNQRLKEFASTIIRQDCWGYHSADGFEIQELAIKLNLLEPHIATEDDVDPEHDDFEVGDTIYVFTDILAASPQKGLGNERHRIAE